jgi:uncharacterized membrane protein
MWLTIVVVVVLFIFVKILQKNRAKSLKKEDNVARAIEKYFQ